MRVYNRPMSGGSWASVEDYLPAGNALGYNENWQYRHSGGKFLMMTASGEPSAYYPMDSNGLAVQNTPAQPCVCPVAPVQTAACSPLGYGGCEGGECTTSLIAKDLLLCSNQQKPLPKPKKPRPCNPKERKNCDRFCQSLGGSQSGCVYDGDQVVCSCVFPPDKPCDPKERQACEQFCRERGGIMASCFLDNGKPPVVCNCIF